MNRITILVASVSLLATAAFASAPAETAAETATTVESPAAETENHAADVTAAASEAATPATPEAIWDAANDAYINSEYEKAARLYESILADGLFSMKLYYNLANAYFRNGEIGKAILYYNRALVLAPNNDDVRHNLAIAESYTKDKIEEVPEFFFNSWMRTVRNTLSCSSWTFVSLALLALTLALGIVYLLSQRIAARKGGFYGMLASLLLFIVATSFAASERHKMTDREQAVVMSGTASVKSSPDRSATDLFVLHEGTKVRIVETVEDWSEIVIADGKKGWIENGKIERI